MRLLAAPILLISVAMLPAQGWRDLKGKPCPKMKVKAWLNTLGDRPTTKKLKGKVWLLAFFRTKSFMSMQSVDQLSELHTSLYERGFRVLAISSEPLDDLESELIDDQDATYWIGSDPKGRFMSKFLDTGFHNLPQYFLIDKNGVVVRRGLPSKKTIERLIVGTFDVDLERKLHPKLDMVRLAYDRNAYGTAWRAAAAFLKDEDKTVVADARFVREKVEEQITFRRGSLENKMKGKNPNRRAIYATLLVMRYEFAALGDAIGRHNRTWLDTQIRKLQKEELWYKGKTEKKAWRKLESILRSEIKGYAGSEYQRQRCCQEYEKLAFANPRTSIARIGNQRIQRLKAERKPKAPKKKDPKKDGKKDPGKDKRK